MSALTRTRSDLLFEQLCPGSLAIRGTAVVLLLTLQGCGASAPTIEAYPLSSAEATACSELIDSLPDTLAGEPRRLVTPADAAGAAWGDPAYVLTCGVPKPDEYTPAAPCNDFGGVGWFIPDDQLGDVSANADLTALTHSPYVELRVPATYRTHGVDAALTELAPLLSAHLRAGEPCL